ncbi:hypothetical protein DKX38_011448 [Salix brachista]|uniref:Reverse transcriptase zinc-binding domain-containing protein n=1 Tax=Salix brachista TaxID=2182728 RepID=A0A5N5LZ97_9ROSI|nr:hypothetical protein DKX38_011448 [Salix brachista]
MVGDQWRFPAGDEVLSQLWSSIPFQPHPNEEDGIIWNHTSSGRFSIASAWDLLRAHRPTTNMQYILWHPLHVPRLSFILWLASQGRLSTKDRVHTVNMEDGSCKLCNQATETHEHLFFQCLFSAQVWQTVNNKAKMHWPSLPWADLLQWAMSRVKKKGGINNHIGSLLLSSTVYHLWQERNRRIFCDHHKASQAISADIYQQVRTQLIHAQDRLKWPVQVQTTWNLLDDYAH